MSSDKYEYVDLDAINDIADGDAEFLKEIINNYFATVSDSIKGLNEAINDHNEERIIFFAHKLKGSFGFVGATVLQQLVMDIETPSADINDIRSKFAKMMTMADKAENELKMILDSLDS